MSQVPFTASWPVRCKFYGAAILVLQAGHIIRISTDMSAYISGSIETPMSGKDKRNLYALRGRLPLATGSREMRMTFWRVHVALLLHLTIGYHIHHVQHVQRHTPPQKSRLDRRVHYGHTSARRRERQRKPPGATPQGKHEGQEAGHAQGEGAAICAGSCEPQRGGSRRRL